MVWLNIQGGGSKDGWGNKTQIDNVELRIYTSFCVIPKSAAVRIFNCCRALLVPWTRRQAYQVQ